MNKFLAGIAFALAAIVSAFWYFIHRTSREVRAYNDTLEELIAKGEKKTLEDFNEVVAEKERELAKLEAEEVLREFRKAFGVKP